MMTGARLIVAKWLERAGREGSQRFTDCRVQRAVVGFHLVPFRLPTYGAGASTSSAAHNRGRRKAGP
jgi:hypothetical protein